MSDKAIERALQIVNAVEWSGDMRVNMTTVLGAGRVLAKALEMAESKLNADESELVQLLICNERYVEELETKLDAVEARLRRYEPEPGFCEHNVPEGDWCKPCNKEYKRAIEEGGRDD